MSKETKLNITNITDGHTYSVNTLPSLSDFERGDYERLKSLESQGREQYCIMRKEPALTEDAVLSFINQLSPWNLKTTGADILREYTKQANRSSKDINEVDPDNIDLEDLPY